MYRGKISPNDTHNVTSVKQSEVSVNNHHTGVNNMTTVRQVLKPKDPQRVNKYEYRNEINILCYIYNANISRI